MENDHIIKSLKEISLSPDIKAVVFDCYGTLMEITNKKKPYKVLLKDIPENKEDFAHIVMTSCSPITELQRHYQIIFTEEHLQEFDEKLKAECDSIKLFPETEEVINNLKSLGIKVAVCSNLSIDYGKSTTSLKHIDEFILSYQEGCLKPSKDIFVICENRLKLPKENILFVGDTYKADYLGALDFGFKANWIKRDERLNIVAKPL